MVLELNKNDKGLLEFCSEYKKTTRQIAEHLGIAIKNVLVRLEKLEKPGLIVVERGGVGKTTFIRTKKSDKTNNHILHLLEEVKKRKGVTKEEYLDILPLEDIQKDHDKFNAKITLPLIAPKLIQEKYFITPEGEKFLKDHKK